MRLGLPAGRKRRGEQVAVEQFAAVSAATSAVKRLQRSFRSLEFAAAGGLH